MTQYIPKAALLAEIERIQKSLNIDDYGGRSVMAWSECFKNFLDTLEVKEVDLDVEIAKWEESFKHCPASMGYKETAKYFFELGLKAQKGE